jgi:hypothetical protein
MLGPFVGYKAADVLARGAAVQISCLLTSYFPDCDSRCRAVAVESLIPVSWDSAERP